ncbi:MAG: FAD-binding oxidoreductase [Gemmatimonadaceae bacterium]|nr:FAD-binding oxidoreductase [Chitinophagaceae bacterium]
MTKVDYLIVGQGLCGTWLSYFLDKADKSFIVIDEADPHSSSRVAAGIINPVTGRRIVKTWMIDELLPAAIKDYHDIGEMLSITCIRATSVADFFPTPQMRLAFFSRFEADNSYLQLPDDENDQRKNFNYDFGYGIIHSCQLVNVPLLLSSWASWLTSRNQLVNEKFSETELILNKESVSYRDIEAKRIIFCDGVSSADSPWFRNLPFAKNKGEVLLAEIPDLAPTSIYKRGLSLVPWKDNLWWVGSSHEWAYDTDQPTPAFFEKTSNFLKAFLRIPYKITDHLASVRPATLERRPFAGMHPSQPLIGILNGMGTKGCSIAPWFAREMASHLTAHTPIMPEADISRFRRILQRGES